MVKQVMIYVDKFGRLHDTLAEAESAEARYELIEVLTKSSAYGEMQVEDVSRVLDENADLVLRFLGKAPKS